MVDRGSRFPTLLRADWQARSGRPAGGDATRLFFSQVAYLIHDNLDILMLSTVLVGLCIRSEFSSKENLQRDVLVHEMIHMYNRRIDGRKHDGLLGHGRYFRRQVRRIKREFGINVDDRFKKVEFLNPKFQPKTWEMVLCWLIDR